MESSCSDLGKWDSGREMNVIKKNKGTRLASKSTKCTVSGKNRREVKGVRGATVFSLF